MKTPGTNNRLRYRSVKLVPSVLLLFGAAFGLAACGGSTGATSAHESTTSTTSGEVAPPKGESAENAPLRVTYGSGTIGAADPTTTVPSERGQQIGTTLNPGQELIIQDGRVLPKTLEAAPYPEPITWYNLSTSPQRIVFDNPKFYPVDSGTIPPGGTFTWTPPSGGPYTYTLLPSRFTAQIVVNEQQ